MHVCGGHAIVMHMLVPHVYRQIMQRCACSFSYVVRATRQDQRQADNSAEPHLVDAIDGETTHLPDILAK